eukprot:5296438-Pyramimonas_sp.AAC.1
MQQWAAAEQHYCGSGISGGVGNFSLRILLRQLEGAKHGGQLAEVMVCIATGGCWTDDRKFQGGLIAVNECPR